MEMGYGMGALPNQEREKMFGMSPLASPNMSTNSYTSSNYSPQSLSQKKCQQQMPQNDAAKFVCNACFMGFRRNRDLKCHINKSHNEE
jgi:hypothetical protein